MAEYLKNISTGLIHKRGGNGTYCGLKKSAELAPCPATTAEHVPAQRLCTGCFARAWLTSD